MQYRLGLLAAGAALLLALGARPVDAAYYQVILTRRGSNLYQDLSSRAYIVTRYCYEYVYGDRAVLSYEPGGFSNQVLFSSGRTCPVDGVYRANALLTRVRQDVYRDAWSGGVVRTFACYEYAVGDEAIVLDDVIIFSNGERCDRRL